MTGTASGTDAPEDESDLSGILEIFHAGAWGTFCTRAFRIGDADAGSTAVASPARPRQSLPGTEVRALGSAYQPSLAPLCIRPNFLWRWIRLSLKLIANCTNVVAVSCGG